MAAVGAAARAAQRTGSVSVTGQTRVKLTQATIVLVRRSTAPTGTGPGRTTAAAPVDGRLTLPGGVFSKTTRPEWPDVRLVTELQVGETGENWDGGKLGHL